MRSLYTLQLYFNRKNVYIRDGVAGLWIFAGVVENGKKLTMSTTNLSPMSFTAATNFSDSVIDK
jgi:hypothetical protein